jgi:hypothetical protein
MAATISGGIMRQAAPHAWETRRRTECENFVDEPQRKAKAWLTLPEARVKKPDSSKNLGNAG